MLDALPRGHGLQLLFVAMASAAARLIPVASLARLELQHSIPGLGISKRTFFFKQFPDGYFEEPAEKELYTELIDKPLKTSETVFTVLTYPFKDANDYTFQNVQSNMTLALKNGDPEFPSLVGCDFDESFDQFTDKQWKKLQSKKGKSFSRYAFQACLKAIACRFEGDRGQVEADLKGFQKKYYFVAKPSKSLRNSLVPRSLLMAGGL